MWSKKLLANANLNGYKEILTAQVDVSNYILENKNKEKNKDDAEGTEPTNKEQIEAQMVETNSLAYSDLMNSMNDNVFFGIVDSAVSKYLPDGDGRLAWKNLVQKYEPRTSSTRIQLKQQFANSRLKKEQKPDEWVQELMHIRQKLATNFNDEIDEEDVVLNVINNLPRSYEDLVISF